MSNHLTHKGYFVTGNFGDYRVFDTREGSSPPVYAALDAKDNPRLRAQAAFLWGIT